jgi:hypothetical protein
MAFYHCYLKRVRLQRDKPRGSQRRVDEMQYPERLFAERLPEILRDALPSRNIAPSRGKDFTTIARF